MKPGIWDWLRVGYRLWNLQEGEKLLKTSLYRKYHDKPCPYHSNFSFIRINGSVCAIDSDKDTRILGKGSFGKVKRAFTIWGSDKSIKIINENEDEKEDIEQENTIAADVGLSLGDTARTRLAKNGDISKKHYTLMDLMPLTLAEYLEKYKDTLTDEARLQLAIECCLRVQELHSGQRSKSKRPYAHLDIKPANFMLPDESKNEVRLIDFGLSETNPFELQDSTSGTMIYLPPDPSTVLRVNLDILALKRTLFLPEFFPSIELEEDSRCGRERWILTEKIIKDKKLEAILSDNLETVNEYTPAYKIAARLILAYYNQEESTLPLTKTQCITLINAYQKQVSTSEFKRLIDALPSENQSTTALPERGLFASNEYVSASLNNVIPILRSNGIKNQSELVGELPNFRRVIVNHQNSKELLATIIQYLFYLRRIHLREEVRKSIDRKLGELLEMGISEETLATFKNAATKIFDDAIAAEVNRSFTEYDLNEHKHRLDRLTKYLLKPPANSKYTRKDGRVIFC